MNNPVSGGSFWIERRAGWGSFRSNVQRPSFVPSGLAWFAADYTGSELPACFWAIPTGFGTSTGPRDIRAILVASAGAHGTRPVSSSAFHHGGTTPPLFSV